MKRYQVYAWVYGSRSYYESYDSLHHAIIRALALDTRLNHGDAGISSIEDTENGTHVTIGNGVWRDYEAKEWDAQLTPEHIEAHLKWYKRDEG